MACHKKKLDELKAMMIVAYAQSNRNNNFSRRECRYYYCEECKAYHTTSKLSPPMEK
jgi:hypothetical protein